MDPAAGSSWLDSLRDAIVSAADAIAVNAPGLLLAVLVLVAGWIVARLARAGTHKLANISNRLVQNVVHRGAVPTPAVPSGMSKLAGNVAFAVILFLSLTIALEVAGFSALFDWFRGAAALLPNVVIGTVIIVVGYLLGVVAADQVRLRLPADDRPHSPLPGVAQFGIAGIATIVGLDQMGLDVALLVVVTAVFAAAVSISFAVAFSLGARDYVRNLIGAKVVGRQLAPGVRVKINGVEGTVLEITATQIALDNEEGRVLVPAYMALDHIVVIDTAGAAGTAEGDG